LLISIFRLHKANEAKATWPVHDKFDASHSGPARDEARPASSLALLSSSPWRHPTPARRHSYPAFITKEIQTRDRAKKRLDLLKKDEPESELLRGKETLRRLEWAKEIADIFPMECERDFT
jgi:hypothetical protein